MCDLDEWRDAVRDLPEMERAATELEHWSSKGMYWDEPEDVRND